MKTTCVLALVLVALAVQVSADCYMQYPPGSNDRNRERSDNRNNADLLFDSQNNAQGGYPWRGDATKRAADDGLTYYSGSNLQISWTSQHGCGANPNTFCDIVLQYGCDDMTNSINWPNQFPGLRDGWPDSNTLEQADNNNAGYQRLRFSDTTCTGNDCQAQNQDGTQRIPSQGFTDDPAKRIAFYYSNVGVNSNAQNSGGIQFAMHEGPDSYDECKSVSRNKGLYVADQNLNTNDRRATRQNPNGGRRGLECPEERDYYPNWYHSDWNDIAVLTSTTAFCDYYTTNSENVKPRLFCDCGQGARDGDPTKPQNTRCDLSKNTNNPNFIPIDDKNCGLVGGTWTTDPRSVKGLSAPYCGVGPFGRDNHLGNAAVMDANGGLAVDPSGQPEAASFNWNVPAILEGKRCVIRVRYNISTNDYNGVADRTPPNKVLFDFSKSCPGGAKNAAAGDVDADTTVANSQCYNDPRINVNNRPLYNRPYVNVFGKLNNVDQPKLSIALNTNQAARTFQDRSYVFHVAPRPNGVANSATIWNLNVRGRRGNIVQCYPSVEYDFNPTILKVTQNEFVHIQFHGSNFNAAKNANNGEGWQYSDRSNMVQIQERGTNFPLPLAQMTLFSNPVTALRWGLLDQDPTKCDLTIKNGDNNEQNNIQNCGKLNQAPSRFPVNPADGLMQVSVDAGSYYYVSTRNNNFSNRSQKGQMDVAPDSSGLSTGAVVAIVFGSLAGVSAAFAGVMFYGKKNPNSAAGSLYNKVSGAFVRKTTTAPEMEYQRH